MTIPLNRRLDGCRIGRRQAKEIRERVFKQMLQTRASKYYWWIWGMKLGTKLFLGERDRVEIMLSIYAAMRIIDDVVDGDAPLPQQFISTLDYVGRYTRFVQSGGIPTDDVEGLFAYAFALAVQADIDLREEVVDILNSLRFDAERRDTRKPHVLSHRLLQLHFHTLDIRGTISACLKLAGEDKKGVTVAHLRPLGEASRIYYNLRDLKEDALAGFCNIPADAMRLFGLQPLESTAPEEIAAWCESRGVVEWCRNEGRRGRRLLAEHAKNMETPLLRSMHWRTRMTLNLMYRNSAQKYFDNMR